MGFGVAESQPGSLRLLNEGSFEGYFFRCYNDRRSMNGRPASPRFLAVKASQYKYDRDNEYPHCCKYKQQRKNSVDPRRCRAARAPQVIHNCIVQCLSIIMQAEDFPALANYLNITLTMLLSHIFRQHHDLLSFDAPFDLLRIVFHETDIPDNRSHFGMYG